jgi:hypothetical protein
MEVWFMKRPSIFSSTYKEDMRRRRINIFLIILIIISASYFGARYYIEKNNIKFLENIKIAKFFQFRKSGNEPVKEAPKDGNEGTEQNKPEEQPKDQIPTENPPKEEIQSAFYDYSTSNGSIVKIEYVTTDSGKEIKGLKDDTTGAAYDISIDKQSIVFEDKAAQEIILCDINGNFKNITLKKYVSKTTGSTLDKEYTIKNKTWYVWSQRPHFTMDGRVVYISHLPYARGGENLYLWVVNTDGTGHKKVGDLSANMGGISYEGYTEDGRLKIKDGETLYYFAQGAKVIQK